MIAWPSFLLTFDLELPAGFHGLHGALSSLTLFWDWKQISCIYLVDFWGFNSICLVCTLFFSHFLFLQDKLFENYPSYFLCCVDVTLKSNKMPIISDLKHETSWCTCGVTVAGGHVGQVQMANQTGTVSLQPHGSREGDDLQQKTRNNVLFSWWTLM